MIIIENIKRGDIFFVNGTDLNVGSEQQGDRPAIIVSNNKCNTHSEVVEVVFCTTKNKANLPTHVKIDGTPYLSVALCEQVTSVSKERLGEFIGTCSEDEMRRIDKAIAVSLGLQIPEGTTVNNNSTNYEIEARLKIYEEMYKRLLNGFISMLPQKRGQIIR